MAWATPNTVFEELKRNENKIKHGIIGTHLYQTSPEILMGFLGSHAVRYLPPDGPLFHPKVYAFKRGNTTTAIIGSHNLTAGAFDKGNIEASLLYTDERSPGPIAELLDFIRCHWLKAKPIADDDFLFDYKVRHAAAMRDRAKVKPAVTLNRPRSPTTISPFVVTWSEFVRGVRNDQHHSLDGRLMLLETAHELFEKKSFSEMSRFERKAIAGTYGKKEQRLEDLDWAWFGSMIGAGVFKNLVNESPDRLSLALDAIPLVGEITERHYLSFIEHFNQAFNGKVRQGGVATASRLLAMKRPDWFIAINKGNLIGISEAFGMAPSTLTIDNYWERLVLPLRFSDWWSHERPVEQLEGRIWDKRAAMLDSLYYTGLGYSP